MKTLQTALDKLFSGWFSRSQIDDEDIEAFAKESESQRKQDIHESKATIYAKAMNAFDTLVALYGYTSKQLIRMDQQLRLLYGMDDVGRWRYWITLAEYCEKHRKVVPRNLRESLDYYNEDDIRNILKNKKTWRYLCSVN